MSDPRAETTLHWALVNGAHLTVLSAFALAQPLFDILGQNPEFFAVRGSSSTQIVLFALVVLLALPLLLTGIEVAVSFASRTAAKGAHLVFVGCLSAVVALYVITKAEPLTGMPALVAACLSGVGAALLYARVRGIRAFVTVLIPAPFVFLALFLASSPVSKLVFLEDAQAKVAAIDSKTPVVVILFDELPTASLLDRDNRIDRKRWPNFATLASQSVWFRNATTVHSHTVGAVPSILTGRLPVHGKLPTYRDQPENLFTLFAGSHKLRVIEVLHMCPPSLCVDSRASRHATPDDDTASLVSDAGVVYLHLVLPDPYAANLPPVDNAWGNFADEGTDLPLRTFDTAQTTVPACGYNVCRFVSRIRAGDKPSLYFLHESLPHGPWRFLPSGKRYDWNVQTAPSEGAWPKDAWLPIQAQQRYLLQAAYTDRALGVILNKLRRTGIYNRALVVVTADHGESFRAGLPRRDVRPENLADIAFVPLFVKPPGRVTGRIDDSFARTIDILPTMARVLGARLPWAVNGRSLLGPKAPPRVGVVRVLGRNGKVVQAPLRVVKRARARELKRQHELFGTGPIARVYRIGPNRSLLGKRVSALDVRPSRTTDVELDGRKLFGVVNLATDVIPSYVTGRLTDTDRAQQELAISVNGTIRAVTRSYAERGETKFAALVPEESLRAGANNVSVFAVRGRRPELVLEELRQIDPKFRLVAGATPMIRGAGGVTIRVEPKALIGEVRMVWNNGLASFTGWAGDAASRRRAERILVFVDGRSVHVSRTGRPREDVRKRYKIVRAGFAFSLPKPVVPAPGNRHQVRVFAVLGPRASELRYPRGNPWRR